MHDNGTTSDGSAGAICCEPKTWLDNGIFPVEYADASTVGTPDLYFVKTIELLWRAVLVTPADQEAYRHYRRVPEAQDRANAFIGQLTPGALRLFLTSAGVVWRTRPKRPTCHHASCHEEWRKTTDEWALPRRLQTWVWVALTERVEGQICWPVLERPVLEAHGDWSTRRWPRPRPLPWEDGDGYAGH
jgi:hypothetical protein